MGLYGYEKISSLAEQLGDLRQVCGIEHVTLRSGRGAGNHIIQVRNGSGLRFDVNVSRGFDIGLCELFSVPVSWISPTGHVSPHAYDPSGTEWNRGFEGGLLASCGLQQAGQPNTDDGEVLGQHGRVSYIPAEILSCEIIRGGEEKILLRARVCESKVLGDKLVLYRSIVAPIFKNEIEIHDEVVNEAYTNAPHLMLYHINFGYPLISSGTIIDPFDSDRELIRGNVPLDTCFHIPPLGKPDPDVILHTKIKNKMDLMNLHISNEIEFNSGKHMLHVFLDYNREQCPYLTQWRCQRRGVNVFAFEPGNVSTKGRSFHRQDGTLAILEPGESRKYDLRLAFKMEGNKP